MKKYVPYFDLTTHEELSKRIYIGGVGYILWRSNRTKKLVISTCAVTTSGYEIYQNLDQETRQEIIRRAAVMRLAL